MNENNETPLTELTADPDPAWTTEEASPPEKKAPSDPGFLKFGLKPEILSALAKMGYKEPSPIQEETIPLIMQGKDIIGQAETGSGKTAACGIPILNKIDVSKLELQALVLVPTRELAVQYVEELARIAADSEVRCFAIYGGFSMPIQQAKLRHGVHLIVGTPGRLIDHLYRGTLTLSSVTTFIIDEADEMLDLGFIKDIEFMADCILGKHQTLLFSATMPATIKALAGKYMTDPVHVALNRSVVSPKSLKHYFLRAEEVGKTNAVLDLIKKLEPSQALIFCKSRMRVMSVFEKLRRKLTNVDFLHGGLDQIIRQKIMERFKAGKLQFLVATDLAARGLDIGGISHVLNYDIPENPEVYTHRTGRAARQGREGIAISLMSIRENEYLCKIQKRIRVNINLLGSENSPVPEPSHKPRTSQRKDHYRRPTEFTYKHKRPHRDPAKEQ
jgi:ATP-dependent RNA helicase DeaD